MLESFDRYDILVLIIMLIILFFIWKYNRYENFIIM